MLDFEKERHHLTYDIVAKSVQNPLVLKALDEVPRHLFIPTELRAQSYQNHPVEIGYGQTISQPLIVAMMTDALNVKPDHKILEIGTGSGYQAAVLSKLAHEVYSIEIVEELAVRTQKLLTSLGYSNIHTKIGDGTKGWKELAPYDGIIATAAARELPPELTSQLKDGGVLVIPIGGDHQQLKIFEKRGGILHERDLGLVRFVPMTGDALRVKSTKK
jgi:protein-L-isoaspartate(D-aspartate) O-methyltransferase